MTPETSPADPVAAELAAIGERWEALSHRYGYVGGLLAPKADVPRLLAALEAVLKLHSPIPDGPEWCRECGHSFPCWTRRVISRALTGGTDAAP